MLLQTKCYALTNALASDSTADAKKVIVCKTDFNFPPYRMQADGSLSGFQRSLDESIFKDSPYEIQYINETISVDELSQYQELSSEKPLSLGWRFINDYTQQYLAFSKPLFDYEWGVFTLADQQYDLSSYEGLRSLRVGVCSKCYPYYVLTKKGMAPTVYPSTKDALYALQNGELDAVVDEQKLVNYYLTKENWYDTIVIHPELTEITPVGFSFQQGNDELLSFVNKRIDAIIKNGEYEQLYMRYFLAHSPLYTKQQKQQTYLLWILSGAVLIALIAMLFYLRHSEISSILKKQKHYYDAILKNSKSMSIVWNTDFTYIEVNKHMQDIVDESVTPLTVALIPKVFCNENDHKGCSCEELLKNALDQDGRRYTFTTKDHRECYVIFNSVILKQIGKQYYILSVGTDVTENTLLKRELTQKNYNLAISEERYSIALESADIGILMVDVGESNTVYLSESARSILGFTADELLTFSDFRARLHPDDYKDYTYDMNRLFIGLINSLATEVRLKIHNGEYHYFLFKCRNSLNLAGEVIRATGAFIDVTSQKEIHQLIDKTAFEDELTGLANRRKFMLEGENILIKARETERKAALIYFDIDRFQRINNLSGYDSGDMLLKNIAVAVTGILPSNAFFARLGGDDFGVLMYYNEREEVENFVAALSDTIGSIKLNLFAKEKIAISAGISLFWGGSENVISLYDKANMALSIAKTLPNERFKYFDQSIQQLVLEREVLEKELQEAYLQRQFVLYYQPKISFETQTLEGVEALIRWVHPQKGIIPPSVFIPVAEEIGLITQIDEWGMREACKQNKRWQDMGFKPIKMSVNISQAQFYHTDIMRTIETVLAETGLDAKWLELELTETMAMRDIKRTIEILKEIKAYGISISMDDFGSGYSSLSSLKMIPIDILKIDRSLVIDVETNGTSKEITAAIVSLAKSMKLVILAEGVETAGQLDFLKNLGCDLAQGYYFGKPMPKESFVEFFNQFQ